MEKKEYHLIQIYDAGKGGWGPTIVHEGNPLPKVRELIGGRWTSSVGKLEEDGAAAFRNTANGRRAFVMSMPKGLPLDAVYRVAEAR